MSNTIQNHPFMQALDRAKNNPEPREKRPPDEFVRDLGDPGIKGLERWNNAKKLEQDIAAGKKDGKLTDDEKALVKKAHDGTLSEDDLDTIFDRYVPQNQAYDF